MKKTTAIILILIVMVIALAVALVAEVSNNEFNIIVSPNGDNKVHTNEVSGDSGDEKDDTQIEPDSVIVKDDITENPTNDDVEIKEKYDLIVFSAEPEGISAAIQAARSNMKVLLVEEGEGPGGLMTYGMLNTIDMNWGIKKTGRITLCGVFCRGILMKRIYLINSTMSFDSKSPFIRR